MIVELTSPATASVDFGKKKDIYEKTFRTPYYFIFDPFDQKSLQRWHLKSSKYQELQPNDKGCLWCEWLELWLGTWEGTIQGESAVWLRFYDEQGNLVLLPGEYHHQRAEHYRQLAEHYGQVAERLATQRMAAKLKELGVDPDSV